MRKLLSILAFVLLLLPTGSALASAADKDADEAQLPLCCRRAGAHHCAMSSMERGRPSVLPGEVILRTLRAKCTSCPSAMPVSAHHESTAPARVQQGFTPDTDPHSRAQTDARRRVSSVRTRNTRGPPALSLL